jgi:glycosyltransferase involved in cell wall biosynthesis
MGDIVELVDTDARMRGVDLAGNFGQHMAIRAGLEHSRGRWLIVMDGDLKDRPEEIPRRYGATRAGYDIVLARRAHRRHALPRRIASAAFHAVLALATGLPQDPAVANFGVYRRAVIDAILSNGEHRYFPLAVRAVGARFTLASIDVEHSPRAGRSSYSVAKMLALALDALVGRALTRKSAYIVRELYERRPVAAESGASEPVDRGMVGATGIEPVTPWMSTKCSSAELRARTGLDGGVIVLSSPAG